MKTQLVEIILAWIVMFLIVDLVTPSHNSESDASLLDHTFNIFEE